MFVDPYPTKSVMIPAPVKITHITARDSSGINPTTWCDPPIDSMLPVVNDGTRVVCYAHDEAGNEAEYTYWIYQGR